MPAARVSVVLATRLLLLGGTLALALEDQAAFLVTVLHPDDPQLRSRCADVGADVVVLEMTDPQTWRARMSDLAGLAGCRVIALAQAPQIGAVAEAMSSGAYGFITVNDSIARVRAAIQDVCAGGYALPRLAASRPAPASPAGLNPRDRLTVRETQVLRLLAEGRNTTEIAAEIGVSINTTRTHVQNILTKLGVHSRLEAAAYAANNGLAADNTGAA